MKALISLLIVTTGFIFFSCDGISLNTLTLDNQSDYDVTVQLETGNTNSDGSIAWETFSVDARSETTVEPEDKTIYVKSYTPSDLVNMDLQDSNRKIVFTNK